MHSIRSACALSILSLVILAGLIGCDVSSPKDRIIKARASAKSGDYHTAQIELKNVLQENPNSTEARFLLAQTLFASQNLPAAEVELRKALAGGHDPSEVVPILARLLVDLGQPEKAVAEFGKTQLNQAEAMASLSTTLAQAEVRLGALDKAAARIAETLRQQPGHVGARVIGARLDGLKGDFERALQQIEAVIKDAPTSADALIFRADIMRSVKLDSSAAIADYKRVLEVSPDHLQARLSLISIYLTQGNIGVAREQFGALQKSAPGQPETRILGVQFAMLNGDFKAAHDSVEQLLKQFPDNPRILHVAGWVEMRMGSLRNAETRLGKAMAREPDLPGLRATFARLQLQYGQADKALATLAPLLARANADADVMALAGEAWLQIGDVQKATKYFSAAATAKPGDSRIGTSLALTELASGQVDKGLRALGDLSRTSGVDVTPDKALIAVLFGRGDVQGAMAAIEAMEQKVPKAPDAPYLRGQLRAGRNDLKAARESFQEALTRQPDYFAAVEGLVAIDMREKKPKDALARYEAYLAGHPKHVGSLRAVAALKADLGASREESVERFRSAIAANPIDPLTREQYIDYLLVQGKDPKAAMLAAQEAAAALPDNPTVLKVLGRVQMAVRDSNAAIRTMSRLTQLDPGRAEYFVLLAQAQLQANSERDAVSSFRQAMLVQPRSVDAYQRLIVLHMMRKRYPEALATARSLQKQRPAHAEGYRLEGEVHMAQKAWPAAVDAYRQGLQRLEPTHTPVRLHQALASAGRSADADRFAAEWTQSHPADVYFALYMGDLAMSRHDYPTAERHYSVVVKATPDHAMGLNNLAWIRLKTGGEGALDFAERAAAAAPNNPAVLDTLAHALLAAGQALRATETAKRSISLAPGNAALRLSAAKLYAKAGNRALATVELDKLEALVSVTPSVRAEAAELRKSLGS